MAMDSLPLYLGVLVWVSVRVCVVNDVYFLSTHNPPTPSLHPY